MAKFLSVLAKIIIARKISTFAMSIYSLTLPTLSLLLNIAQLGIPTTVSKLIAKRKHPIFKIMQVSLLILLTIDLIVGIIYIFLVPYIANSYLQNPYTTLTLYGMVLLIPLVSLTSLLKGYFIGIDRVNETNKCQISEELSRLLFIVLLVDLIDKNNVSLLAFFAMFSNIIGEIASLIHLLISSNFKSKTFKDRIICNNKENKIIANKIVKFSLMNTSTRLIGSFIYFLEPIIYTTLMLKIGISNEELTLQYGIINSYVLPLLLLPSFFSGCISTYMLPKLSSFVEKKSYKNALKSFISTMLISFIFGFMCLTLFYIFPDFFTKILYGKLVGINYIKRYCFFMCIYYLQMPIHIALISFDKEKNLLFESILCNIIKIVFFLILIPKFQIDGMLISILISIYFSFMIQIITLFNCFITLKHKDKTIITINT